MRIKNIILALILITLPSAILTGNTISGKVLDQVTGELLQGASVRILGTSQGAITNEKGIFKIKDINKEFIEIKVTYLGYKQKTREIDLNKNSALNLTIEMEPSDEKMQEIEVVGEAEGQVKAFIEQKEAVNIKNIVSAEQIEQFPDMNAAEAIQRIPGITLQRDQGEGRFIQLRGTPPELTNFNINGEQIPSPEGNVRYVGMDVISADQIDFIEVSKVLTPDMDADGIAGSVNIITKKATSREPEIRASLAGGYNNLRATDNYQIQLSYGERYKNLGFHINGSYYINNQGSDNMEYKYAKGPFWGNTDEGVNNYKVQYREVQLRHYDITRERTGLSATLDYEFDKNNIIYLRSMYNSFSDDEIRRRMIYDLDDAISETYYLYGGIEHDIKDRIKTQNISTLNFGGENEILGSKIDYELSYALATEDQPNRIEARFGNPGQAIAIKFNKDDPDFPKATFPDEENAQNAFDYENYDMDNLLYETHKVNDRNYSGKLNIKIPYLQSKDHNAAFKFGTKFRFKEKVRDITAREYSAYRTTSRTYPGTGDTLALTTVSDGFKADNFLNHGYKLSYMPSAGKINEFYTYNREFFITDRTGSKSKSYGQDYSANEDIYAGYAMLRHDYKNLMVLGGVRYELTNIDYEGRKINTNPKGNFESMDTLADTRTHEFVLPQFQLRYAINTDFNLRGAWTYSYSRPNFEDVLPYREEDREEVKYGNPNLDFPKSMNIDLLAENYLDNGGLISGGVFYKKIDDFIFFYKRFAHEGEDFSDYPLVEIEKALNGIEAFVYGVEIQTQSKFSFLDGFFKDFGVYLNYTFTHSEAYIYKRIPANLANAIVKFGEDDLSIFSDKTQKEQITLPGQAKHTSNLALFYDNGSLYVKLTANYHDAFLYQLGADKDLDEYYDEAWHLDFNASYKLNENLTVFADAVNLTNSPLKHYLGSPDRIKQQEFYSWWGRIGVKIYY